MSCSSPLMANISAKPLPESPLELDIKNAKKATRASAFVVDTLAALLFIPLWYTRKIGMNNVQNVAAEIVLKELIYC